MVVVVVVVVVGFVVVEYVGERVNRWTSGRAGGRMSVIASLIV